MARRTIKTLRDLEDLDDGQFGLLFTRTVQRLLADCFDRPANSNARKCSVELIIVPIASQGGNLQAAQVHARLKHNLPNAISSEIRGGIEFDDKKNEITGIVYNDLSPDDPRQMTIDQVDKKD